MALFIFYNSFRESVFLVQNDNGYKEIFNSNYDKKGLNIMP